MKLDTCSDRIAVTHLPLRALTPDPGIRGGTVRDRSRISPEASMSLGSSCRSWPTGT